MFYFCQMIFVHKYFQSISLQWVIVEIDVAYEEANEDCGEDDEDELLQMEDVVTMDVNDVGGDALQDGYC